MEILLTIAIPTYNRGQFVKRLLDNILPQCTPETEILVSDNCSTDDTCDIVNPYLGQISYIRNTTNIGPDGNFLQCYRRARGKFVWLLGDDDLVVDGAIPQVVAFLKGNMDISVLFFNYKPFKLHKNNIWYGNCFLKEKNCNEILEDKNNFLEKVRHHITFMSCFLIAKDTFLNVQYPEKYVNSYFIHTLILLDGIRNDKRLAVMYKCVILQNCTPNTDGLGANLSKLFIVFGQKEKAIFCDVAVKLGYNKKLMRRIYSRQICKMFMFSILSAKAHGVGEWKTDFKCAWLSVKEFALAYITVLPAYLCPAFFARYLQRYKHNKEQNI